MATNEPPPAPSNLKAGGKKLWKQTWKAASIWMAPSDVPTLTLACELRDQVDTLKRREAATRKPEAKLQWFYALAKAQRDLASVYDKLGFNPTARAKLGLVVAQAAETESRLTRFAGHAG